MFRNSKDQDLEAGSAESRPAAAAAPPQRRPGKAAQQSIIGADLTIKGDLVCDGDLRVDGRVDGDIVCRTLTLGDAPVINSKVKADEVQICGEFSGEIRARTVILKDSARVKADIYQENLVLERGATFEGHVGRLDEGEDADTGANSSLKSA